MKKANIVGPKIDLLILLKGMVSRGKINNKKAEPKKGMK